MAYYECLFMLLWVGLVALLGKKAVVRREVLVLGKEERRYSLLFAIVVFLPVVWMAANRPNGIGDTTVYRSVFYHAPNTWEAIPDYYASLKKDKFFSLIAPIFKSIFGANDVLYFGVIAAFQAYALIVLFRKYSDDFILSFFLFIVSADYLSWMFNGMRQFVAVSIIISATIFMINKRYIPLILTIVFASGFHQSALIMLPIVFLVQGTAWNKKTIVFIILTILIVLFVGQFTDWLDGALNDTQYTNVVSDYTNNPNDNGTHPLRVLVYSIPAILSFVGRKQIQSYNNPLINLCTNMSIITSGLYVVSMFTSGIFLGRLPIYTSLYSYILLPWELENVISEKRRQLFVIGMIIAYLLYYYYQVHMIWGYF